MNEVINKNQQRNMPRYTFTLDDEAIEVFNKYKLKGISHSALVRLAVALYDKTNSVSSANPLPTKICPLHNRDRMSCGCK